MVSGELVGVGENGEFGRVQARQIGKNVRNAVNSGEREPEIELFGAASGEFDAGPTLALKDATIEAAADLLGDKKLKKEILSAWEKKRANVEREESWDRYIGKALKAKENEIGSMMSSEERAEFMLAGREKLESGVREKIRGNKGFGRAKGRLVRRLAVIGAGVGAALFLSACGKNTEKVEEVPETVGTEMNDGEEEFEETEVPETEQTVTEEEEMTRSLDEILELSKDLDFSQLTYEDLELAGNDPELLARFEAASDAKVLENGVQLSFEDGYYSEEKIGRNNFGPSQVECYGNSEKFVDGMMAAYFAQPQELAAGVSGFDTLLRVAGIDEEVIAIENLYERAQAISEQILTSENGGALQARLRGALKLALMSDKTAFHFYIENRVEDSFYLKQLDPSAKDSPETNLVLMLSTLQRHGARQVQVVLDYGDYKETMDYNLNCGDQPNLNERGQPRQPIETIEVPAETVTSEVPPASEAVVEDTTTTVSEEEEKPKEDSEEKEEPEEKEESKEEPEKPENPPKEEAETVVQPKDPEGQKEVVSSGEQTNPVGVTQDVDETKELGVAPATNTTGNGGSAPVVSAEQVTGDTTGTFAVTEEPVLKEGNAETTVEQQVGDADTLSEQEEADLDEQLGNMSDAEFADALDAFLQELQGSGGESGNQ